MTEYLRRQIEAGELRSGDRIPSLTEMQSQFGASRATVQKVHQILEQDGLIVREQGRGTFIAKRSRARTGVIGCYWIGSSLRNLPYYLHLLEGMQKAAHQIGDEVLLLNPAAPSISWEKIDGVVAYHPESQETALILPDGMKCVSIIGASELFPSVVADEYQGMKDAVKYLTDLGHQRIAYLYEKDSQTEGRMRGYEEALREAAIEPRNVWRRELAPFHPEEFRGRGRVGMRQWLRDDWGELCCTALMAQNDRAAMGALEAFREAGVRVPEDVSVIGFDSTDECDLVTPRLTSVAMPLEEISAEAVRLLLEEMKDNVCTQRKSQTIVLPTRLDVRESVSRPLKNPRG